jgi:hypothetical protein
MLWAGEQAVTSHRTAGWLWGLVELDGQLVELSVPEHKKVDAPWLRLYEAPRLLPRAVRIRQGLRTTSPARTLVDLAAVLSEAALEQATEQAVRNKLVSPNELRAVLARLPKKGRPGTGRMRQLLTRGMADPKVQSQLERLALRMFLEENLPSPSCQYRVIEGDRLLGTVDFAWPQPRVIVEAEGFAFHAGRVAWERDIARYNALVHAGWCVLRLTKADVGPGRGAFVRSLAATLGAGPPRRELAAAR